MFEVFLLVHQVAMNCIVPFATSFDL